MLSTATNKGTVDTHITGNAPLVTEELTKAIEQAVQPVMVKGYRREQTFLAIGAKHGKRLMLQINVHASEIPTLLRARSVSENSNNPGSGKNRPVNEKHIEEIKNYIIQRAEFDNKWILGTITANVDPGRIKYQHIWGDLYVITIPNNTSLEITDGQHRKKVIAELIESEGPERELICDCTFPVNLVLEDDFEQCQTDFCDMAQTYPIAKSLLVAYGGFGRDAIAQNIVDVVGMFRHKTQKIKSTPGSKTGHIYTINYIAKLVSCAFSGEPNNNLSEYQTQKSIKTQSKILSDCLNDFFSMYSPTKNLVEKENLHWQEATAFRDTNILGISVGLEILGKLLHHTFSQKTNSFDLDMVSQLANEIDWSKEGKCWSGAVVQADDKGGLKISAGRSSVNTAYLRCIDQLGW